MKLCTTQDSAKAASQARLRILVQCNKYSFSLPEDETVSTGNLPISVSYLSSHCGALCLYCEGAHCKFEINLTIRRSEETKKKWQIRSPEQESAFFLIEQESWQYLC